VCQRTELRVGKTNNKRGGSIDLASEETLQTEIIIGLSERCMGNEQWVNGNIQGRYGGSTKWCQLQFRVATYIIDGRKYVVLNLNTFFLFPKIVGALTLPLVGGKRISVFRSSLHLSYKSSPGELLRS